MADDHVIHNAIEFFGKIKDEGIVRLKFIKKDGSERVMLATLDFKRIPKRDHPKGDLRLDKILKLLIDSKMLHVYDLEKSGWRSVPYDKVQYLETRDNVIYSIKKA